jgi:hypothetical protein
MYQDFPLQDPQKIYPNWDFGLENKPSGNPVWPPCIESSRFACAITYEKKIPECASYEEPISKEVDHRK